MSDKRVLALWLSLLGAVIVLSLLPGEAMPGTPVSDAVEHWLAYLLLAALPVATAIRPWVASAAMGLLIPLGLVLEIAQLAIPGRAFEWRDAAANAVGVLGGVLTGWVVRLLRRPQSDLSISP